MLNIREKALVVVFVATFGSGMMNVLVGNCSTALLCLVSSGWLCFSSRWM